MFYAFVHGEDEIVSIFSKYLSIDTLYDGRSMLHWSCFLEASLVERLLKLGANVRKPDHQGFPPLVLAFSQQEGSFQSKATIMARLLDAGGDIEIGGPAPPLLIACCWNNLDALTFLLERGANPNPIVRGTTPLVHCCLPQVNVAVFKKLLMVAVEWTGTWR